MKKQSIIEFHNKNENKNFILFYKECIESSSYKKYIGDFVSNPESDDYIIVYNNPIGILEIKSINKSDSNLTINIFFTLSSIAITGIGVFKAIDFIFIKYGVHKIIFQVYEFNEKMLNFLNKIGVVCEGEIIIHGRKVYIYSILEYEYNSMKNVKWRDLIRQKK